MIKSYRITLSSLSPAFLYVYNFHGNMVYFSLNLFVPNKSSLGASKESLLWIWKIIFWVALPKVSKAAFWAFSFQLSPLSSFGLIGFPVNAVSSNEHPSISFCWASAHSNWALREQPRVNSCLLQLASKPEHFLASTSSVTQHFLGFGLKDTCNCDCPQAGKFSESISNLGRGEKKKIQVAASK